jgi:hypothetical protein
MRVMQGVQKACLQTVMTGLLLADRGSRQIGQSSAASTDSWSCACKASVVSGVRVTTLESAISFRRAVMRVLQSFQWQHLRWSASVDVKRREGKEGGGVLHNTQQNLQKIAIGVSTLAVGLGVSLQILVQNSLPFRV